MIEKAKRDCEFPLYFIAPTPPIPFYIEKINYPFPQIPILLSTAAKEDLYTYLPNTKTTVIIKNNKQYDCQASNQHKDPWEF